MQDLRKEEAADLRQRKASIKSKVKRAGNAIAKMSFLPYTPGKADLTGLDGFKLSLTIHAKNKMKKYKAPKSPTKNIRRKSILKKKRSSKNISEFESDVPLSTKR